MSNTTVQIDIELVTSAFKTALTQASNQTKQFSQQVSSNFDAVKSSFAVMAGSLAANAFTKVASSIIGAFGSVIDEAAQAEQSLASMNVALKQAGLYSSDSSEEFQAFADEIERVSVYSGDAAQASIGLFASLTTLSKDGIKKATQASADLAATLNIDLTTATDMIAKAVNGNVSMFQRLGIEIQKGSTDAERLTNTLKALESQQGAAAAASNTYAGAIAKIDNQKGKLLEAIGKLITQNPVVIEGINSLTKAFTESASWIENNTKLLSEIGKAMTITAGIAATVGIALGTATVGFSGLATAATATWVAVTGPVGLAVAGITAVGTAVFALVHYWDDLVASTYNATAAVIDYSAKAVAVFSEERANSLKAEAQAWREKAQAIQDAAYIEEAQRIAAEEDITLSQEQTAVRKAKIAEEQADILRENNFKLEQAKIQNSNLALIDQERVTQEQEIYTQAEQAKLQTKDGFDAQTLEKTYAAQEAQLLARQDHERQLFELQVQSELAKANLEKDAQTRADAVKAVNDKAAIDRAKLLSKQQIESLKQQVKAEQEINKNKIQNRADTFSTIATLSQSSNKELAAIGKAAGITQIAIDTPVAISKAMAAFPPPFNFAAAALVGTAMAAQAANIAGVKFADGGIVPGSSNTGDRISAQLNSGEMVLNRNQQANLFKIANHGTSGSGADTSRVESLLMNLIEAVKSSTSIQIDGREIISVVRDGISSGRSLA